MAQLLNVARATVTFLTLDLFLMFVYTFSSDHHGNNLLFSLIIEAHGGPRKSLVS